MQAHEHAAASLAPSIEVKFPTERVRGSILCATAVKPADNSTLDATPKAMRLIVFMSYAKVLTPSLKYRFQKPPNSTPTITLFSVVSRRFSLQMKG